ncbi:MAG: 4-alpha-glucanotransferase [Sphaerochaetaceae bacterium]|nr:4-alpha-glucanotransferase [Sphaerochaetaceae bacterium]
MKSEERNCGVLLHPTSLPSKHGIGSLGESAFEFIDLLKDMKITLWQILPLGPTGYGDSPYASRSTFAGNELLIDLNELAYEGYLELTDVLKDPFNTEDRIDYNLVRAFKEPLLRKAAIALLRENDNKEYKQFIKDNAYWLDDYALYTVLVEEYNDSRWFVAWPEKIKKRDSKTISELHKKYKERIEIAKAIQYFFFAQWHKVKDYANENGIQIIGDIPIFVAGDSVDAWANVELLKMDEDYHQLFSAGVPPDAFSDEGQLWGNPVYDWNKHEETEFNWWVKRIRATLDMCDIVRIDHFRGLEAYWEVPSSEKTALNGKWVKAPGQKLLNQLKKEFSSLPLIAEDLGVITDEVEALRDNNNLPGMKILQFAFGFKEGKFDSTNAYLPHHCSYNSVVYSGTHDNDTTRGWFDKLSEGEKDIVRRYLESSNEEVVWKLIRTMLFSNSKWAIIPMQDILELDTNSRMNTPSTCGSSNWSWRLSSLDIEEWRKERLSYTIEMCDRIR